MVARASVECVRTTRKALVGAMIAVTTVAALISSSGVAGAAPVTDPVLQQDVNAVQAAGAPGVLLRVTDNGVVTQYRAGTTVLGTNQPVPFDARFRIGSVTKMFTATVVLQLVAQGRVDLDAPVARYLPGLLPDGDAITVRMILQHTSGLHDYTDDLPSDNAQVVATRFEHWDARHQVAAAGAVPLLFTPGTNWSYSNTNYLVAGLLITAVTGRSWQTEVTDRIIRPLRLTSTYAPGDDPFIPGPHPHGYVVVGDQPVDISVLNPTVAGAAGGLISSTADLDTFLTAQLRGTLLPPAELAEIETPNPFTHDYGIGMQILTMPCGITVYGHEGGIYGYSDFVLSTLDGSRRVEAMVTTANGPTGAVGETLLEDALCR